MPRPLIYLIFLTQIQSACSFNSTHANTTQLRGDQSNTDGITAEPCTPDSLLSAGAALLFGCIQSSLTIAERNHIFDVSGLRITADNEHLVEIKEVDEYPAEQAVFVADINQDGNEDVFIQHGHHSFCGTNGRQFEGYFKTDSTTYKQGLKVLGADVKILTTIHNGFPDIVPQGGGFQFNLYAWDGKSYKPRKSMTGNELSMRTGKMLAEIATISAAPLEE